MKDFRAFVFALGMVALLAIAIVPAGCSKSAPVPTGPPPATLDVYVYAGEPAGDFLPLLMALKRKPEVKFDVQIHKGSTSITWQWPLEFWPNRQGGIYLDGTQHFVRAENLPLWVHVESASNHHPATSPDELEKILGYRGIPVKIDRADSGKPDPSAAAVKK